MHILIHQFFKFYLEQLFPKPSLFFLFGENPFHSSSPTIIHIPEKHAIQLSHTNFSLLHILFCSNTQLSKFAFFKHVHENIFFPPDLILAFDRLFCRFQRHYRIFSKLAILFRWRKSTIAVDYDLLFNKLFITDKNVLTIYQHKKLYLFQFRELLKLIQTNITYCAFSFIFHPLPIKNPHNNVVLNKSTLYNIYFFIRFHTLIDVELLYLFFRCNFNMKRMLQLYGNNIRRYAIQDFLNNGNEGLIREHIEDMIYFYNSNLLLEESQLRLKLQEILPAKTQLKKMKPYLHLYLIVLYSLVEMESKEAEVKLIQKLKELRNFNLQFGTFCEYPTFNEKETVRQFLHSHYIK